MTQASADLKPHLQAQERASTSLALTLFSPFPGNVPLITTTDVASHKAQFAGITAPRCDTHQRALIVNAREYNAVAPDYQAKTAGHAPKEHGRIDFALELLGTPRTHAVVDLACGCARDGKYWVNKGFRYYGIDISQEMLRLGASNCPQGKFYLGDIVTTPIAQNSADIIWASSAVHHLPDEVLPAFFNNVARGLRPGGIFFANYRPWDDKKAASGVEREGINVSTEYVRDNGVAHVERFICHHTLEQLQRHLTAAGLTICDSQTYATIYTGDKGKALPMKSLLFATK